MEDKKDVVQGVLGTLPSLVGLATQLGTAIPSLRRVQKTGSSRAAAGEAASAVGRAAVGGSQTGFGASRGLNLRTGLRAAGQVAKETGGTLARAANQDEVRYQNEKILRNNRLQQFGRDAADMGANIGQSVIDARAAKNAEDAAADAATQAFEAQYQDDLPGISSTYGAQKPGEQLGQGPDPQELPVGPGPGLDDIGINQYGEVYNPLDLGSVPHIEDPLRHVLKLPQKEALYQIAPELDRQHQLENLVIQETERQGQPIARIYAYVKRMQNLPAIRLAQEQLQLEQEFRGF